MSYFMAEDFRNLVNKLNEYMITVDEDNDNAKKIAAADSEVTDDKPEDQELDDLLTTPAGIEKITGSLDIAKLAKILKFSGDQAKVLNSAIIALHSDPPHPTKEQALMLAEAFVRVLKLDTDATRQLTNMSKTIKEEGLDNEAELPNDVSMDDIQAVMKNAANASPVARMQITALVQHFIEGMKEKHADGGINHVMNYVAKIVSTALDGDKSSALDLLSEMVAHVEGDKHAINGDVFPLIVTDLILVIGELVQSSKIKSPSN